MKTKLLLTVLLSFAFYLLSSQVPQGFNYQAIARNSNGLPITSQTIPVRISIVTALTGGTVIWQEEHSLVTADQYGMISLVVGAGAYTAGTATTFSAIDWSAQTLYLKTEVKYPGPGWTDMGTSQIWAVPYSLLAKNIAPLSKLGITGTTTDMEEALFEVKNKAGQTVFAVYNEGVRAYVGNGSKGVKGGFAVGGYDATKGSTIYDLFTLSTDSARLYFDSKPLGKGVRGGFSVGGYDMTKGANTNFLNISTDTTWIINPSQNKILWYPLKNAFMTGKILIEKPDSVGINSFTSGFESKSMGPYSQALGYKAIARGDYSTAIGKRAEANNMNSFAFGDNAKTTSPDSYAFGAFSEARGAGSFAFGSVGRDSLGPTGKNTIASGDYSFAFGLGSYASGESSFAFGADNEATNNFSMAFGVSTKSMGWNSTTFGYETEASAWVDMAIGYETVASGQHSFAGGDGSMATSFSTFSFGNHNLASQANSVALGQRTKATGENSFAMGQFSEANGKNSTTFGTQNFANGSSSIAGGQGSTATENNTFAFGYNTLASGVQSVAMGQYTIAIGNASFSLGDSAVANEYCSVALGNRTLANGNASVAMGCKTVASNISSMAVGQETVASGYASFAGGHNAIANAPQSFSFGYNTLALGEESVAFGNQTLANNYQSFAMGNMSQANGWASVAFGSESRANGASSAVFGLGLRANSYATMVTGRYNDTINMSNPLNAVATDPVFVIGNGTSLTDRKNAFTVLQNSDVGINMSNPQQKLDIAGGNGRVQTGYNWLTNSDIRYKKNISTLEGCLEKVMVMRGVSFDLRSDSLNIGNTSKKNIGFIAQELENVVPEVVVTGSDGYKSVAYDKITALLTEAIKEQQQQIESTKRENQQLKSEIDELKTLVNSLIANQTAQVNK